MRNIFTKSLLVLGASILSGVTSQAQLTDEDYSKALWMTTRFYGGQRATDANNPEPQHNWVIQDYKPSGVPESKRGISFAQDADGSYDLSGGWFDCGDHVFFGQTGFFAGYALLKSYDAFPEGYDDFYDANYAGYRSSGDYSWEGDKGSPNGIPDVLDEAKHATDFFIKAARNSTTFYFEKGEGDKDHKKRITSVLMQTEAVNDGGELRKMWKNPNGASMASMCGATLALMSRVYRPFDATYADLCEVHAKYAYDYAKANPGSVGASSGSFYSADGNWKNGYAMMLSELYMATNNNAYKTEALAMSTGSGNDGDVHPNAGYTFDYQNTGELALYALAEIGHPTAEADFNTRIQAEFLANGSYNGEGVYKDGGGWGKMRYVGNAAYLIALYNKVNNQSLDAKVYGNVDYILGDNSGKQSYISGFVPNGISGVDAPLQIHHRNMYHYEGNSNSFVASFPTKNEQNGALVGGSLDGSYNNLWTDYVNTEVCVDYNVGIVGALAAINKVKNPVDPNQFLEQCSSPDLGADVSLCGVGSVDLQSGLNPQSGRTFEWFKDGVSQGGASSSLNNRTITQGGTWKLVVDSLGVCSRSSSVVVSASLPTVELGGDIDLCSPSTATLDAGVSGSGVSYMWSRNGLVMSTETSSTLDVSEAGTYSLSVSASGCGSESDDVIITSSLPETQGDVFCIPHSSTATLEVINGTGDYRWYTSPSSTSPIGTEDFLEVTPTSSTTYYVEDVSAFNGFVGPTSTSGGNLQSWGEKGYGDNFWIDFHPTTNFSILKMSVPIGQVHNNGTAVLGVEIRDTLGNIIETFTSETKNVTQTSTAQMMEFTFTDMNILLSWGSNLRMAMQTNITNIPGQIQWNQNGSFSFPYTTSSGAVTISGVNAGGQTGTNFTHFYNWEIAAGTDCDRIGVLADLQCTVSTFEKTEIELANVFPNPSMETATIRARTNEVSNVTIINTKGQVVDSFILHSQVEFGATLETGVYIVQIQNGEKFQTMKFVKK